VAGNGSPRRAETDPGSGGQDVVSVLKKRKDFVRAAKSGVHVPRRTLAMQGIRRKDFDTDDPSPRIGFTTSRKVGNAVKRNRARRRLREAAKVALEGVARPRYDYVLIGRPQTVDCPFDDIVRDIRDAASKIHQRTGRAGA